MKLQQFILATFLAQIAYGISVIKDSTGCFDYIVVGAGSAGVTVASRLSENPTTSVLLLEAGPEPPKESLIPLRAVINTKGANLTWNYSVEPNNRTCLGQPNERCRYEAAHVLGGDSSIITLVYNRGNKVDYDLWEEMGATGWNYYANLPYFKKAEGEFMDPLLIDFDYHGRYGNLTTSHSRYKTEMQDVYLEATRQSGYPTLDYNGKCQGGFGKSQLTVRNGYRCSVVKAYLEPAHGRENLKIITGAFVTKIDIDITKTVKGVYYVKDGYTYYAEVNKEVIVSAGAINTPKLLMLSGIGPKKHLEELKIKVVQDLPVGQNLHDHIAVKGLTYEIQAPGVITAKELLTIASTNLYKFPKVLEGVRGTPLLIESVGFLKSPYEKIPGDYNDIQLAFSTTNLPITYRFKENILAYYGKKADVPTFSIVPTILHPKSRGTVTLSSCNPHDPPIIKTNYLQHPDDLKALLYAMKKAHEITNTPAFAKYKPDLIGPAPCCGHIKTICDEYFECLIKQLSFTYSHGGGTCKIGHPLDPTTVVDPELKVKGIHGLRVVDQSIIPIPLSASTTAAAIMIGEKAAAIIDQHYCSLDLEEVY